MCHRSTSGQRKWLILQARYNQCTDQRWQQLLRKPGGCVCSNLALADWGKMGSNLETALMMENLNNKKQNIKSKISYRNNILAAQTSYLLRKRCGGKNSYRCVKTFNNCLVKYCILWSFTVFRGFYSLFLEPFCFLEIFKL